MKHMIIALLTIASFSSASAQDGSLEPDTICRPTKRSIVEFYSFENGDTHVWLRGYTKAIIKQRGFTTKVAYQSGETDIELALNMSTRVLTGHVSDERGTEIVNVLVRCR